MFLRPVDALYPIGSFYAEWHPRFEWSMDPDNGFWVPIRASDGRGQHRGTDFCCPIGTPVLAMADGVIIRSRHEDILNFKRGSGLFILQLLDDIGYDSWMLKYAHLKASYVEPGQRVRRGDPIAESGNSGAVDSAYLHVDLMNLTRQWKAIPLPYEP